ASWGLRTSWVLDSAPRTACAVAWARAVKAASVPPAGAGGASGATGGASPVGVGAANTWTFIGLPVASTTAAENFTFTDASPAAPSRQFRKGEVGYRLIHPGRVVHWPTGKIRFRSACLAFLSSLVQQEFLPPQLLHPRQTAALLQILREVADTVEIFLQEGPQ